MNMVQPLNQHKVIQPYLNQTYKNKTCLNKLQVNQYNMNQYHVNKIPDIYMKIYREYYIQQFKSIYSILVFNHQQNIELNNQIYVISEMIRYGKTEYQLMLNNKEMWFKIHLNNMNYLIMNVWKFIDEMDKSCFPNIDFRYDNEFRNIYMLFELIQQIISNKIE
jgi:hypothetical protein